MSVTASSHLVAGIRREAGDFFRDIKKFSHNYPLTMKYCPETGRKLWTHGLEHDEAGQPIVTINNVTFRVYLPVNMPNKDSTMIIGEEVPTKSIGMGPLDYDQIGLLDMDTIANTILNASAKLAEAGILETSFGLYQVTKMSY